MKTQKEHQALCSALDAAARTMLGCSTAFVNSGSGYHGLARMALKESWERSSLQRKIAMHMTEKGTPSALPPLPAPLCSYVTPYNAIEAMCVADQAVHGAIAMLRESSVAAGESTDLVAEIKERMNHEAMELSGIKKMVMECETSEDFLNLNSLMLEKYT
jgi:hypothetical protein